MTNTRIYDSHKSEIINPESGIKKDGKRFIFDSVHKNIDRRRNSTRYLTPWAKRFNEHSGTPAWYILLPDDFDPESDEEYRAASSRRAELRDRIAELEEKVAELETEATLEGVTMRERFKRMAQFPDMYSGPRK